MPSLRTILHSPATTWFFIIATLAAVALGWLALPLDDWLRALHHWFAGRGVVGMLIFAIGYVVAVIALVPTTPLTIAAGVTFGAWAMPIVLVASTVGAVFAFILARHLARGRVEHYVKRRPKWRVVDTVIADHAWQIVALIRLSPFLTFGLQNYLFGITRVRIGPYTTATLAGIIPSTALCIYVGAAGQVMHGAHAGMLKWTVVTAGFVFLLGVTIYTARLARTKLLEAGLGDLR